MQLPSLPTDNLYKFLALFGLVIVILGVGYPTARVSELQQKVVELEAEVRILELEVDRHKVEDKRLSKDVERYEQDVSVLENKRHPSQKDLSALRSKGDELKAIHDLLVERTHELEVKTINISAKREIIGHLISDVRFLVNSMYFGVVVGSLLMYVGFWLWYVRVQRPQDLALRRQGE